MNVVIALLRESVQIVDKPEIELDILSCELDVLCQIVDFLKSGVANKEMIEDSFALIFSEFRQIF